MHYMYVGLQEYIMLEIQMISCTDCHASKLSDEKKQKLFKMGFLKPFEIVCSVIYGSVLTHLTDFALKVGAQTCIVL